jgi:hypothetical protein
MARTKMLKPGDKVAVPLGLDEVVGVVLNVYGPPGHKSVFVRVPIHGPSGETLDEKEISFPAHAVRAVIAV